MSERVSKTLNQLQNEDNMPTLWSYWRSSCSWRVRMALSLKSIRYNYQPVHLVKNEQMSESYKELNSSQQVPTLQIDGKTITQSLAIIEYLDRTHLGGPQLIPVDPAEAAKVRELSHIIASGIQPIQNLAVTRKIMSWAPSEDAKKSWKVEWGKHWITVGFQALEKALQKTAGRFCVGNTVTMADLCLVPQVYNANRFKVDMTLFPTIARINNELEKLDAVQASHPDKMPDAF